MELNLVDFSKEVYQNAVDHGWHESNRSVAEIVALIHSELSEALEEYRCSRPMVWYGENGKPEGIAIELLDAVIRILDFCGKCQASFDCDTIGKMVSCIKDTGVRLHDDPFPDFICELHYRTSKAYGQEKLSMLFGFLIDVCCMIFTWLDEEGFDSQKHLIEKHEFNKSRPYKHGNKVC